MQGCPAPLVRSFSASAGMRYEVLRAVRCTLFSSSLPRWFSTARGAVAGRISSGACAATAVADRAAATHAVVGCPRPACGMPPEVCLSFAMDVKQRACIRPVATEAHKGMRAAWLRAADLDAEASSAYNA